MPMKTIDSKILALMAEGEPFTAADVTEDGELQDHHEPNSDNGRIGSMFRILHKDGLIEAVGAVNSTAPHRHGGLIRIWQSTPQGKKYAKEVTS